VQSDFLTRTLIPYTQIPSIVKDAGDLNFLAFIPHPSSLMNLSPSKQIFSKYSDTIIYRIRKTDRSQIATKESGLETDF
jgi:hypothetical protein